MKKIIASSILVLLLIGCGGSGSSDSGSDSNSLQFTTGETKDFELKSPSRVLIRSACSTPTLYDEYGDSIANNFIIDEYLDEGRYSIQSVELYTKRTRSKGVYFHTSSSIQPDTLSFGSTYTVPERETQIYKFSLSETTTLNSDGTWMNTSIYNSTLDHESDFNFGAQPTLSAGTYYLIAYPRRCSDDLSYTFKISKVK